MWPRFSAKFATAENSRRDYISRDIIIIIIICCSVGARPRKLIVTAVCRRLTRDTPFNVRPSQNPLNNFPPKRFTKYSSSVNLERGRPKQKNGSCGFWTPLYVAHRATPTQTTTGAAPATVLKYFPVIIVFII